MIRLNKAGAHDCVNCNRNTNVMYKNVLSVISLDLGDLHHTQIMMYILSRTPCYVSLW